MEKDYPMLLTIKQAQEITGIARSSLYELVHREGVPTVWNGNRVYFHRDRFLAWLDKCADTGTMQRTN